MMGELAQFHFLRPLLLLALIPAAGVWWALRRYHDPMQAYRAIIAPHLLEHLVVKKERKSRMQPAWLLLPALVLAALAAAGPTWQTEPSPFAEEEAGLMVVLKITPTMEASDVQPSRLERAKHKMHDLFELRPGAPAGLIAYSGSAHLVMPLTQDSRIIEQMAEDLEPSVMPVEGDVVSEALLLAQEQFERRRTTGTILLIADGINPGQLAALEEFRKAGNPPVQVLAAVGSREAADQAGLGEGARALGAPLEYLTVDDNDVRRLNGRSDRLLPTMSPEGEDERWKDFGYYLLPVIAILTLAWSRRGWSIRWQ